MQGRTLSCAAKLVAAVACCLAQVAVLGEAQDLRLNGRACTSRQTAQSFHTLLHQISQYPPKHLHRGVEVARWIVAAPLRTTWKHHALEAASQPWNPISSCLAQVYRMVRHFGWLSLCPQVVANHHCLRPARLVQALPATQAALNCQGESEVLNPGDAGRQ